MSIFHRLRRGIFGSLLDIVISITFNNILGIFFYPGEFERKLEVAISYFFLFWFFFPDLPTQAWWRRIHILVGLTSANGRGRCLRKRGRERETGMLLLLPPLIPSKWRSLPLAPSLSFYRTFSPSLLSLSFSLSAGKRKKDLSPSESPILYTPLNTFFLGGEGRGGEGRGESTGARKRGKSIIYDTSEIRRRRRPPAFSTWPPRSPKLQTLSCLH